MKRAVKELPKSRTGRKSSQNLPLEIDCEVEVRSASNAAFKAKTRIVGAVHGAFIIIHEPEVVLNDRLLGLFEDGFACSFIKGGYMYRFNSDYLKHLSPKLICIEYPEDFEVMQIRKHRRICVNIETRLSVEGTRDPITGSMTDISKGGCCLVFPTIVPVFKGQYAAVDFNLPDCQPVSGVRCKVLNARHSNVPKATELGLSFTGPVEELAKVSAFCDHCMLFRL